MPPGPVTAARLEAKIAETKTDPALKAEVKGRLVDLHRRALGNLPELQDNLATGRRLRGGDPHRAGADPAP